MSSLPQDFSYSHLKNRNYKAEEVNVNIELMNGPLTKKRRCTDCLCCILFFVSVCCMFGIAIHGYINGEVEMLLAPVNGNGQICGFNDPVQNFPYLYVPDIKESLSDPTNLFQPAICCNACPTTAADNGDSIATTCVATPYYLGALKYKWTAYEVYPTTEVFNYCIPTKQADYASAKWDQLVNAFESSFFGGWIADLYKARWVILVCIFIAIFIACIYIKLMDWFAVYIAWGSVILLWVGLVASGVYFFIYNEKSPNWATLTACIGLWTCAGIYCLCFLCCFKNLRVSIAIIETAADWFADTKRIIFIPVMYFSIAILVFAAWICGLAMTASVSMSPLTGQTNSVGVYNGSQAKTLDWSTGTYWMVFAMWFMIIWIMSFIMASNEFVVVSAAVTWYFSNKEIPDDDGIPGDSQVMRGLWWSVRYHMGSLAFGSFILAVLWVIHWLFEYLGNKLHDATAGNACTKCMLCCCHCCIDCFDRFLRFLNQNAYIYMSISSESFCMSAINAFLLILKNSVKFALVNELAWIFMFIAKLTVSVTTTWLGFLLLGCMIPTGVELSSPFFPILMIFFLSYVVATIFISIFDAGANALLQCYLFDLDIWRQKGEVDDKHVPEHLKRFFKDHGHTLNKESAASVDIKTTNGEKEVLITNTDNKTAEGDNNMV